MLVTSGINQQIKGQIQWPGQLVFKGKTGQFNCNFQTIVCLHYHDLAWLEGVTYLKIDYLFAGVSFYVTL